MLFPADLAIAQNSDGLPWLIRTDKLTTLEGGKVIVAEGDVVISRGDTEIKADYIRYDREKDLASLKNNVFMKVGEDIIQGEEGLIHLDSKTGWVRDGEFFIKENNVHIKAAEITRKAEDRYRLENAIMTTCDGEPPPWSFRVSEMDLTVEGYATVWHPRFRIRSVPVVYIPYMILPAKTRRQSGFLIPELSYGSRYGVSFNLPFYWVIDASSDSTLYQNYISKRGWMEGLEYRYVRERGSKGIFWANYLNDLLEDDDLNQDNLFRANEKRWWIRGMLNQSLPYDAVMLANLDFVSDRDYLYEFDDRYTGFAETNETLFENFGRALLDKTAGTRESFFQVNKSWTGYLLSGTLRYYEDVQLRNMTRQGEMFDSRESQRGILQTLPAISLQATQQTLPGTPLFYEGLADYVHYWREEGIGAQRLDLFPRISYPTRLGPYFSFRGLAGLRETVYSVQRHGETPEQVEKRYPSRTLQVYEAEISTEISRIFNLRDNSVPKLKHKIVPYIRYNYVPSKDQADLPNLDSMDRIPAQNLFTYSVSNYLTTKRITDEGILSYANILRLTVEQAYDVRESRRTLSPGERRRPFSNVDLEAEITPTDRIYARSFASYNPYESDFENYDGLLRFSDRRGDSLFAEYLYAKALIPDAPTVHELNYGFTLAVTDSVSIDYLSKRSIELDRTLESRTALNYRAQCWGVSLSYDKVLGESRYFVLFSLYGIGQVGPLEIGAQSE